MPSGDQSVAEPLVVPMVMRFSSWPVPLAALMYRSTLALRRDQRIRRPSGDQIGRRSGMGSNVMREGTPRTKSKAHTSLFPSSFRSNAMLFSSGDNRTERYCAAAAATPSCLPLRSIQSSSWRYVDVGPAMYANARSETENRPTDSATGKIRPVNATVFASNGCAINVVSRTNSR